MTDAADYDGRRERRQGNSSPQSVADIARAYALRRWKVVPIPHGEKGCKDRDWPTRTYYPEQDFNGKNIGVQLGAVSGGLTDIDLDTQEAIKLAPAFLPATDAIFGRQSKPQSHWLYLIDDPEAASTIKLMDEQKQTIIELRLGGGGKAALTVFPGSVHASGEKVEWVKAGEPARSTCAILNAAITKIAVAALLARHWPTDNRHEASMRCGGFLARAGWTPEAIQEFMRPVQEVAGVGNDTHIRGGCSAAFDAATHVLNDGKGYGFPALQEFFGEEVTKQIAKILHYRERDLDAELERMNEKYCIMPFGNKVRIFSFEQDPEFSRVALSYYTASDFKLQHDNILMPVGEGDFVGLGTWWIKHPLRRQYDGLTFVPGGERVIDGRWLNMWRGWGIEPHAGAWPLLRKHIYEVLANDDKSYGDYIVKWTAFTLQHPAEQAETVLVFRGAQGCGKGLFGRAMCELFGQHGIHISSHRHLIGNFNRHLLDCTLLFADEAFWPGDRSAEGTLKRLATERTLMIEPKFFDATMRKNRLHIIMSSNNDWVVPAAIDDRRFAVFNAADKYANDRDYFRPLYQELYQQGGIAAMLHELLAMNLGDWHPRYDVPKTAALAHQKELSLSPEDQWWLSLLKDGCLPFADTQQPSRAISRNLFDIARQTVPKLRNHSDHLLGKVLRGYGCERIRMGPNRSLRGWQFPPLAEARAAWDKRMPGTQWEDPNEWRADPY